MKLASLVFLISHYLDSSAVIHFQMFQVMHDWYIHNIMPGLKNIQSRSHLLVKISSAVLFIYLLSSIFAPQVSMS